MRLSYDAHIYMRRMRSSGMTNAASGMRGSGAHKCGAGVAITRDSGFGGVPFGGVGGKVRPSNRGSSGVCPCHRAREMFEHTCVSVHVASAWRAGMASGHGV